MAEIYIRGKDGRPQLVGKTADPQLPGRVTALEERVDAIEAAPGGVQLSDAVDSDSSTTAATSKAAKTAYDKAVAAAFPTGTRLLFHQEAAPTGWTKLTTVNDAVLRVVSGTTGGGTGGSVAFSTLFVAGKTVTLSGNVGETTLSLEQTSTHQHLMYAKIDTGSIVGGTQYCNVENKSGTGDYTIHGSTERPTLGVTRHAGSSLSHTHTLSGSATIDLAVRYTDVIICAKA